MSNSRTKNSAINATVAIVSKIIYIVLSFICKTIFIKTLGTEYLGVNGLFTNILTILSFAELGIGSAIIFKLYKPIANENKERVKTLVHFYKKAYYAIGIFILIVGLLIVPVLGIIVKDAPNIKENISGIYVLFLINTSISYFFTHKKSIITGHQKEYIINLITLVVTIIQNILQIIFLLLTHNYIVYLLLQIGATILDNVIAGIFANKMYPYIKEKNYTKIDKEEQKSIFNDVKSLLLYKLGYTLSNGTDNIIISFFSGVTAVGLLSNYTTITTAITSLTSSLFNGITASIGNLNTIDDNKKKEKIFYQILLVSFYIYGFVAICFTILANKFVNIWLGENFLLSFDIVIIIGLNIYIDGMRYVGGAYRNTMGIFKNGRFIPLISSIVNIILSILLAKKLGMFGVLFATFITRFCISTWFDPIYIHRHKFKTTSLKFVFTYMYYLLVLVIVFLIGNEVNSLIKLEGVLGFMVSAIVVAVLTVILFIIFTLKKYEFKELVNKVGNIIRRKNEKGNGNYTSI